MNDTFATCKIEEKNTTPIWPALCGVIVENMYREDNEHLDK